MTTHNMANYKEVTQRLEEYIQDCAATAADTTHGYKKQEAVLRADGAIRLWMRMYIGIGSLSPEAESYVEHDLVRLRQMVQRIPTSDL